MSFLISLGGSFCCSGFILFRRFFISSGSSFSVFVPSLEWLVQLTAPPSFLGRTPKLPYSTTPFLKPVVEFLVLLSCEDKQF